MQELAASLDIISGQGEPVDLTDVSGSIQTLTADLNTLSGSLADLEETPDINSLSGALDSLSADVVTLSGSLADLEETPDVNSLSGALVQTGANLDADIQEISGAMAGIGIPKPNSVNSAAIINGAVTADKITDGAIPGSKITDGSIISTKIFAGSIESSHILDGTISTIDIANKSITSEKLEDSITIQENLSVIGDLFVGGSTVTVDASTIVVEDKNIEIGSTDNPTDITADGGGITLKGDTDKTILWSGAKDAWAFNTDVIGTGVGGRLTHEGLSYLVSGDASDSSVSFTDLSDTPSSLDPGTTLKVGVSGEIFLAAEREIVSYSSVGTPGYGTLVESVFDGNPASNISISSTDTVHENVDISLLELEAGDQLEFLMWRNTSSLYPALNGSDLVFAGSPGGSAETWVSASAIAGTNILSLRVSSTYVGSDGVTLRAIKLNGSDLGPTRIKPAQSGGSSKWSESAGNIGYSSGNVGIGTTSPNTVLHVTSPVGNGDGTVFIENTLVDYGMGLKVKGGGNVDDERFALKVQNAAGDDILFAQSKTGNVGIGTTSPGYKLHIAGGTPAMKLEGSQPRIWLTENDETDLNTLIRNNGGNLQIDTVADNDSFIANRFTINHSNGNVGVATTSPTGPFTIGSDGGVYPYMTFDNSSETSADGTNLGAIFFKGKQPDGSFETGAAVRARGAGDAASSNNNLPGEISFQTNPGGTGGLIERMTIDKDGNVGIGTTSPSQKLEVSGHLFVNGGQGIFKRNSTSGPFYAEQEGSGPAGVFVGGNVGIGTTTPERALHLKSSAPVIRLEDTDSGLCSEIYGDTGAGDLITVADSTGGGTDPFISFRIGGSPSVNEKMRIKSNGNVGIGDLNPSKTLSVAGDAIITGDLTISGTTISVNTTNLEVADKTITVSDVTNPTNDTANGAGIIVKAPTDKTILYNKVNDSFDFNIGTNFDGNVGIGTAAPAYTLDVAGDINFTGNLTQNGTTFGSSVWAQSGSNIGYTAGKVSIGTTATSRKLNVKSDDANIAFFEGSNLEGLVFVNNTNGRFDILGYSDSQSSYNPLVIRAGGPTNLWIGTDGRVGIGASSAAYTLDVAGDINFTGNLTQNGTTFSSSVWAQSGNDVNYTAGNVGIGTSSAAYTLDVAGNINFTGNLTENGVPIPGSSSASGVGSNSIISSQSDFYTALPDYIIATHNGGYESILKLTFIASSGVIVYEARVSASGGKYGILFNNNSDGTYQDNSVDDNMSPSMRNKTLRWFVENDRAVYLGMASNTPGSYTDSDAISAVTGSTLDMGSNDITTTGKIKFANMYANIGDLPSATTYHGMFAHVHSTGKAYYAHGGNWLELANADDIPSKLSKSGGLGENSEYQTGNKHTFPGILPDIIILASGTTPIAFQLAFVSTTHIAYYDMRADNKRYMFNSDGTYSAASTDTTYIPFEGAGADLQDIIDGGHAVYHGGIMTGDLDMGGGELHNFSASINAQTGTSYTLVSSDRGKVLTFENASDITVTVAPSLGAGFTCTCIQLGEGQVAFQNGSGVSIHSRQSHSKIAGNKGMVSLASYAADTFILCGDTAQ